MGWGCTIIVLILLPWRWLKEKSEMSHQIGAISSEPKQAATTRAAALSQNGYGLSQNGYRGAVRAVRAYAIGTPHPTDSTRRREEGRSVK